MHVGPHWRVLGLLKGPLGQRHLAGGLLSHFWGLWEPLGLALRVKKAVALSSLLKQGSVLVSTRAAGRAAFPSLRAHRGSPSPESKPFQTSEKPPVLSLEPLRKFLI